MRAGELRHRVRLENPGTPTPDGDGGFTSTWAPLSPSVVSAAIEPASARDLERVSAGTVIADASHIVTMRYHAGVTTKTRILYRARTLEVQGTVNPEERNLTTIAICTEIVP